MSAHALAPDTMVRCPADGCSCGCNNGPVASLARVVSREVFVLPNGPTVTLPALPVCTDKTDDSGIWLV